MKRTSSSPRKRIIAAFGMAALVALTGSAAALVDLEGDASGLVSVDGISGMAGVDADVEVDDLDDPELDELLELLEALDPLDELELEDVEVEAVVALIVQAAADLGLDLEDLGLDDLGLNLDDLGLDDLDLDLDDVPGPGDGLDLEDLLDGDLGLVEGGDVIIDDNNVSVGNNILRDAEILNDVDIQIGDSDTLDEILGLAGLVPGLGGPGGGDDSDGDNEDGEGGGAGTLTPLKPAAAKPAAANAPEQPDASPDLVGATTLDRPEPIADVLAAAEVLGDSETTSSRGPLPRTGSSAALAGVAAALLGGSRALSLLVRRRRGDS